MAYAQPNSRLQPTRQATPSQMEPKFQRTEWHRVMLWRRLAEIVERYVRKGDKLFVEGQLRTRTYTDKSGHTRYITEVWADNMELLGKPTSPATSATQTAKDNPAVSTNETCPF